MKEPVYWKAAELPEDVKELPPRDGLSEAAKVVICVSFLVISGGLWLSIDSALGKALYYVLLLVPNYLCGAWLAGKIFSEESGLSVSRSGFSVLRIIVGVLVVLTSFGALYGLALLVKWVLGVRLMA